MANENVFQAITELNEILQKLIADLKDVRSQLTDIISSDSNTKKRTSQEGR